MNFSVAVIESKFSSLPAVSFIDWLGEFERLFIADRNEWNSIGNYGLNRSVSNIVGDANGVLSGLDNRGRGKIVRVWQL